MRYRNQEIIAKIQGLRTALASMDQVKHSRQELPNLLAFLSKCQQEAATLQEWLASRGTEGEALTKKAALCCRDIDQLCRSAADRRAFQKYLRKLGSTLLQMQERTAQLKKEIVFLPYKADMWDSLESVWMAAQADPDCEARVIPIPYYSIQPDGSLGEMHYDGGAFPEGVSITSWQDYDVAEHRPDAIYIHNPYDACGFVIQIHPDFYADKLRQYTGHLVYIPYFVGINDWVDPHHCAYPGPVYAHHVIVESENIRQIYIRTLEEWGKKNFQIPNLAEKIVALGSPKYDRVQRMQRSDFSVPEDWQALIQPPGEKRKLVVFYNISIANLNIFREKMLDKIEAVLAVFQAKQDEIVLLWRPHPLYENNLRTFQPENYERYQAIVQGYRVGGWGIYDDTSDCDRAMALSDAYYGDPSSVASLYKVTGQPMLVENVEVQDDITSWLEQLLSGQVGIFEVRDGTTCEACGEAIHRYVMQEM